MKNSVAGISYFRMFFGSAKLRLTCRLFNFIYEILFTILMLLLQKPVQLDT